ncbi:hypothetical protein ABK040_012909 [Willaertia magna]
MNTGNNTTTVAIGLTASIPNDMNNVEGKPSMLQRSKKNFSFLTSQRQRESLAKSIISKSSKAASKLQVQKKVRVHLKFEGRIAQILKELHSSKSEHNALLVQRAIQIGIKNNFNYQQYESIFNSLLVVTKLLTTDHNTLNPNMNA